MANWKDICTKGFLPQVTESDLKIGRLLSKIIKSIWIGKVTVYGAHNIPDRGPYIMASNHTSWLDLFVLGCLPAKPARILAHECVLSRLGPVSAIPLSKFFGLFVASTKAAQEVLIQGDNLLMCSEGWAYSNGGPPRPFHTGVIRLSNFAKCPVVPVSIVYGRYPGDWILRFPKFQFLICALMLPWLRSGATVVIGKAYIPLGDVQRETERLRHTITEMGYSDDTLLIWRGL